MPLEIYRGKRRSPPRVIVFGRQGIGKSSFAAKADNPLFLCTDRGVDGLDVAKTPLIGTFTDLLAALKESAALDFATIVLDTVNDCEALIREDVKRQHNLSEQDYVSYGKGIALSVPVWIRLRDALETLVVNGKTVVCLAHSKVKPMKNPSGSDYMIHAINMPDAAADLFCQWADEVLFATFAESVDDDKKLTTTGERFLLTSVGDGYYAKNRCGLPPKIALPKDGSGWATYWKHREAFFGDAAKAPTLAEKKTEAEAVLATLASHPKHAEAAKALNGAATVPAVDRILKRLAEMAAEAPLVTKGNA